MGTHRVATVDQLPDGGRLIVEMNGDSIGVFNIKGKYFALLNSCIHQGGPACEGVVLPAHRAIALDSGQVKHYLDYENPVIVCPWHGWEYDIQTGRCLADPSRGLRSYQVRVEDGVLFIE